MKSFNSIALNIIAIVVILGLYGFNKTFAKSTKVGKSNELGKPLFLTPYIASGEIEKARQLSQVNGLPRAPKIRSYSGLFTVNKKYNSNIFFWFFPALNNDTQAPVILWLQGGPGTSGLFGLFTEHGPYVIHSNMTASLREYHWSKYFQVIYVDNPVGTGFSFTNDSQGYATSQAMVAADMYEFLQQFFTVYYEYRKNEFYIAGESYGGKYAPSLAYKIHTEGNASNINLKGIAIGNGMCDPETMMDYGDYLYQLGLVDRREALVMRNLSEKIVNLIRNKDYCHALEEMEHLVLDLNVLHYTSVFKNYTGYDFYYNFLMTKKPKDLEYFTTYLLTKQFRKAVQVGNLTFHDEKLVQKHLLKDIMRSVKSNVSVLMDNYRVLFYNGQMDIIIPYPLTINFLSSVKWKYAEEYQSTQRKIWKLSDEDEIAGYVHSVHDFYEVLVRDAGHLVPYDQPKAALDLISRFLLRKPYN